MTRRQLLRHAGLVAATFPAARLVRPDWALAAEAGAGAAVPMHAELVTVTDTEMVVTWFTGDPTQPDEYGRPAPVAAPGRLLLGTSPAPSTWEEVASHGPTPYHYVRVGGLKPGTQYWFRAESNGVPATPTQFSPLDPDPTNAGVFTTLVAPRGSELLRVAWMNDLHIGEHVSGLAYSDDRLPGGGFPPGYEVDAANPYWRFMSRGAVAGAREHGCTLLLANGDLTSGGELAGLTEARTTLDGFGVLGGGRGAGQSGPPMIMPGQDAAYFVTRGNHDRAHAESQCSRVPDAPDLGDCFRDVFAGGFERGTTHFSVLAGTSRARYRFIGLDSANIATGAGQLPSEQLEFLEAELAAGDATIPLFHHHVGDQSTLLGVPPATFGVNPADAERFRLLLAQHDNVAGVYSGHTHRNNRTTSRETGRVPYFEGASTKEYPGGYTVVRLFEHGYMVNFWKTATPEALAWSERSRGEYLGLYPYYTLGGFADRNWTFDIDARTPRRPTDKPDDGGAAAAGGERVDVTAAVGRGGAGVALPATGGGAALGGAALLAAAELARQGRRRAPGHVYDEMPSGTHGTWPSR